MSVRKDLSEIGHHSLTTPAMNPPQAATNDGRVIGFVAFRAGSKRLPGKNGLRLGSKPLYEIALDKLVALKRSGLLDAVVASTDSTEWRADCGERYGEEVALHDRPAVVSADSSNTSEVILDFLRRNPEFRGCAVMAVLCVYPFLKPAVLEKMVRMHKETNKSVYALVESHHMPQKLLRVGEGGVLRPYLFDRMADFQENTSLLLREHPRAYHTTGAYLIADAFNVLSVTDMWHQDDIRYVMDDSFHVDIDTSDDFELAQLRYAQKKAYL